MLVGGVNGVWAQTVLFSQDFSQGSLEYTKNVAYTKTSGLADLVGDGDNLFTSITTSNTNTTGIAINNTTGGGTEFDASGIFQAYFNNTSGYWSVMRTKDFAATAPSAIKMTFDIYLGLIGTDKNKVAVQFAIGDGFTDGLKSFVAPMATLVHSGFGISQASTPVVAGYGQYGLGTTIYSTGLTPSQWLSITWVINNTSETLTYDNPTGTGTSAVANDCFDIWIKTQADAASTYTKIVSGQAATTGTKDLQEMYIGSIGGKKLEFRMDNIVVTDLTPAAEAYTVNFDAGSHGTCGTTSLTEESIEAGVTLPAVTANTGYTFDGWYTSSDTKAGDALETYNPSKDITLYAHYSAKTYTITLDDNGGSADGETTATYDSNTLSPLSAPTYSGHAVIGYYKEEGLENLIADGAGNLEKNTAYTDASGNWTYDDDVTLYAKWQVLTPYTVTLNANEHGSCATPSLTEAAGGAGVTLPSVTPATHYVFNGWYDAASGGSKIGDASETYYPTSDITLYAQYTLIFTVTYNGNGSTDGSVPVDSNSPYDDSSTVTVLGNTGSLVKTGYTFIGWNTESDGSGSSYVAGSTFDIDDDIILYAVWGENYCELKPATSGSAPSAGDAIIMQSWGYGGTMTAVSTTMSYDKNGLKFGNSNDKPIVTLNDYLKEGSIIIATIVSGGSGTRGLDLYTNAASPAKVTLFGKAFDDAGIEATFQYKVVENDGLIGTNSFQLWRYSGNTFLKSLTVTDCQPGGVITASGWSTYSCNKKLDLSTISGGKAYVATGTEDGKVVVKSCTDIVDAEEGLMIWGTPGAKFTINTTSETSNLSETNLMEGVPNGGSAPVGSYVFGWPTASENPTDDCGFYYVNSAAATLGNTKAYLNTTGSGARLTIVFEDESETTGISDVRSKMADVRGEYYDLQGRKVAQPRKGLYIVNGKKVIIK